jgi:hypothetical protein
MDQSPTNSPYQDDEITLKELIEKVMEFWRELWSKKWWIIALTIPFVVYFGYKAKTTDIKYQASLTYLLNDGGGGGGGISSILGSFGIGKSGKVNMDRIVELSRSRNIMQKMLFTKVALDTLDGKNDFIANHLIELYHLDEQWAKSNPQFEGFRFVSNNIDSFELNALKAFKNVYLKVVGGKGMEDPIFNNGFNEDTGILSMSATTVDDELSIYICNIVYEELKNYYVMSSTKGSQNTFNFVQAKTDSIINILKSKQYQLAKFNDSHRGLTDPNMLVERKILETEISKLTLMYGEATKNFEMADFSLEAGMPDINILDAPIPPLDPIGKSLLMALLTGGLLGGLLSSAFFIGRKIVKDAMGA